MEERVLHIQGVTSRELKDLIEEAVKAAVSRRALYQPDKATKAYLTRQECALYMGISTRQVDYLRKSGSLPWIKRGRRVLFKTEDIRRWLNQGYVSAGGVK